MPLVPVTDAPTVTSSRKRKDISDHAPPETEEEDTSTSIAKTKKPRKNKQTERLDEIFNDSPTPPGGNSQTPKLFSEVAKATLTTATPELEITDDDDDIGTSYLL
jgi:hypothetical protein